MKNLKFSISILAFAAFLLMGVSCGGGQNADEQGKEYTSQWICPMHCEGSGSDEPGTCPVCGMDYIKNENYKGSGHDHDHGDHEGHQH